MKSAPRSSKHTLLCIGVVSLVLGVLYYSALTRSLGGVRDPKADFKNYKAYVIEHNCTRRLREKDGELNEWQAFMHCDNGVWEEGDLNDVANGRVPT